MGAPLRWPCRVLESDEAKMRANDFVNKRLANLGTSITSLNGWAADKAVNLTTDAQCPVPGFVSGAVVSFPEAIKGPPNSKHTGPGGKFPPYTGPLHSYEYLTAKTTTFSELQNMMPPIGLKKFT